MSGTDGGTERSPYEVLGVDPDADAATIRRAWVAAARRHHPDVAGDDAAARAAAERRMQEVNEAWAVLGDPDRRRRFDSDEALRRRREWQPGSTSPGFVPFDDTDDPDDPAADYDVPYGDGSPVPQALQIGPLPVMAAGGVALTGGLILGFSPLVALGVIGLVGGLALFAVAPIYAVMRSSRRGMD